MLTRATFKIIEALVGATLAPILVVSAYLYYSRTQSRDVEGDYLALAAAILVGAVCVQFLGNNLGWFRNVWINASVQLVYICVAAALLFMYMLNFVCAVFGACL